MEETHLALQESVINWGNLLIASGGALKPIKCFYHLISFNFKPDETWEYADNETNKEFEVVVPMPDGGFAAIEHLSVDTSSKTLGVKTCPSGKASGAFERIKTRAQEWVDLVKNGRMHRRQVWFSVDRQFWPKVGYGLSSVVAPFKDLESCLKGPHYQLLPYGGVIRTCKAPFRQLDRGFFGVGLPHVGVENLVECSNKLIMHYGCKTGLGLKMQTSMELFQMELGMSFQPFSAKYSLASEWVTSSWLKMLWEKTDMFGLSVSVNNIDLKFAREGDEWFMASLVKAGYEGKELQRLNRFRTIHQQVLFLSDVLCAKGKLIDRKYLKKRQAHEKWSRLNFPVEHPPSRDLKLWKEALGQLAPQGRLHNRLGSMISDGHKIWEWRYRSENDMLFRIVGDEVQPHPHTLLPRFQNVTNRYTRQLGGRTVDTSWLEEIATVREVSPAVWAVLSHAPAAQPPPEPQSFLEVLREWGNTWIWDDLRLVGDPSWLAEAIADKSLIAVTDGSFIRVLYPNLCSAAFIFKCKHGRGKLVGSMPEQSLAACAYRGELLGLMAIYTLDFAECEQDQSRPFWVCADLF